MNTIFRIVTNNSDRLQAEINAKFKNLHAEIYNLNYDCDKILILFTVNDFLGLLITWSFEYNLNKILKDSFLV